MPGGTKMQVGAVHRRCLLFCLFFFLAEAAIFLFISSHYYLSYASVGVYHGYSLYCAAFYDVLPPELNSGLVPCQSD